MTDRGHLYCCYIAALLGGNSAERSRRAPSRETGCAKSCNAERVTLGSAWPVEARIPAHGVTDEPTRPPDPARRGDADPAPHLHRQSRARHGGGADFRDRPARRHRGRHRPAGAVRGSARRPCPRHADRPAGADRAGDDSPLRPAVAQQLFDRRRALPARLLHDEAQPAAEREDGAAARLRRRASAAAGLDRAGRAGADPRAGRPASEDDRHERRRNAAQGGRPWRTLRHDGDQGGDRGARRGRQPQRRAGPGFRAWDQPGDGRADRLFRARGAGGRRRDRQRIGGARQARSGRRRDHVDQSQHLRPVRTRDRRNRRSDAPSRRLLLLRRRQFQRDRRQDPAGRPRRRRDAHQPAQDVLDPARRRRPGRGASRVVAAARAVRAGPLRGRKGRGAGTRRARARGPRRSAG